MGLEYKGEDLVKSFFAKPLKYIVTGTGRCGTVFLAKFLSELGIQCGHESIFNHDGIECAINRLEGKLPVLVSEISKLASISDEKKGVYWFKDRNYIEADSSYMSAPFLGHEYLKDVKIIHVVRHPMKVINSFVRGLKYFSLDALVDEFRKPYHEFIYKFVPELETVEDPVSKAALFYIRWNQMIENKSNKQSYLLFPIETNARKLFNFLGVKPTACYENKKVNHKAGIIQKHLDFGDIVDTQIREKLFSMYQRYYQPKI